MEFYENLLRLRLKNGFTQQEVADGAGLSLRGYQNYERGQRDPQRLALIGLADFYGLTLDDLVCRTPPEGRWDGPDSAP